MQKWLETASLPTAKLVDTSAAFRDRLLQIESATTRRYGPGGEHSHTGTAFTTWLDFQQAAAQADAILPALVNLIPAWTDALRANAATLRQDLEGLDAAMQDTARAVGDQPLVALHPVYQYWARRYALNIQAVLREPETVPDAAALAELQQLLAAHPAKLTIWEGPPAPQSHDLLRNLGLRSVVRAPCGNAPEHGDFLNVMRDRIAGLQNAVQDSPRSRARP